MIAQNMMNPERQKSLPSFSYLLFKRAWMAVSVAVIWYGILFVAICLGGQLPSFGRLIVFDADTTSAFRNGFWIIAGIAYLIFLISDGLNRVESSKGWKLLVRFADEKIERPANQWMEQHYKLSSFLLVCIMFSLLAFLFALTSAPINTPDIPTSVAVAPHWHPVDKVLIHQEGYEKNHAHAPRNIMWSRNIVAPAKITSLGNGRYLIQTIPNKTN
ncbi:hypothetical protein RU820_05915 [Acidithiobacillus ferrooxidans]|uniref:Uncharacterized protein n=1 Tax=Acidithiobacillus ferrooxidans (strain ATCC 23270 / DSM 14882 / CIP 104768 / NCIMB 8455) TaxID=243159 RepID=B7J8R8_ACIF2|nr:MULTISPECIES: hypothetical protein [Acidithiobacillus]ACK78793.1 hypothetical protein AFE_1236 [Acidithiobacillus ferrooxidans ATCC 23270]MBN6745538.1 hypothetical protein [Acidithiobacillus sp. MC2.2]MBN6748435.1 hypothetical protein [Acidithiobacillus sp. PG05]